jgi:hypothetical protein
MSMKQLLVVLVLTSGAACGDLGVDIRTLTELEKAEARWENGPFGSGVPYVYTVQRMCFCPIEWIGPVRVVVGSGGVTRTYVDSGDPVTESVEDAFPTVEGLFDILREAYAEEADDVGVTYDATLGYPIEFGIDYDEMTADEELGMRVTDPPIAIAVIQTLPAAP